MSVTHWLFSWREDEQPTHEQVDDVVDTFLKNMELEGHQVIYALHKDTENFHVHIAVNSMYETTEKVVQPHRGFDIEAAHKVVARHFLSIQQKEELKTLRQHRKQKIKQRRNSHVHALKHGG